MLRTKIICTIGPASESEAMLKKLVKAGMNIARLNFSHGTYNWHKKIIQRIKKINKTLLVPVAIMLDTKGPEIRTVGLSSPMDLKKGEMIRFAYRSVCDEKEMDMKSIHVTYREIVDDLNKGDIVVLDNGTIEIEVKKKNKIYVYGKVLNKGSISNKKHVNLPGIPVDLPCLTPKDKKDILFGIKQGVDYFALSFVRCAKDIDIFKRILRKRKYNGKVIAKIEDRMAVKNINEIIEISDGIMVARGDLGIEIPIQEVPGVQRKIINTCLFEGKPVIVATHLLESMIVNPVPTRAEATDIANAIWERTDAIMLSGETTAGKFPIRSVKMMSKIAERAEKDMTHDILHPTDKLLKDAEMERSACMLAHNIKARAIVAFTKSGKTAAQIALFRPKQPIYAFSNSDKTQRFCAFHFGLKCFHTPFYKDHERTIREGLNKLKAMKKVKKGDECVVMTSVEAGGRMVETVQVRGIK